MTTARAPEHAQAPALGLQHQAWLEPLLRGLSAGEGERSMSEPWFANLYLFRAAHDYRLLPGSLPCIAGIAYDGASHRLPLFALHEVAPDRLRRLLPAGQAFGPLSQAQVERLSPEGFECWTVPEEADYLYEADTFRHYGGSALRAKRNQVAQLCARHRIDSEPLADAHTDAALQVLQGWMRDKGKSPGDADHLPCSEALQLREQLGLTGFLHRVDGEPAGFVVAQTIQPGVVVMRFAKALDRVNGLYPFMFQHFCRARPQARWINFEQDLGLPNFRQAKRSFRPVARIPKYRVRPRA